MIDPKDDAEARVLLSHLNALAQETGWHLDSCGCCSSISVDPNAKDQHQTLADELTWSEERGSYYIDAGHRGHLYAWGLEEE